MMPHIKRPSAEATHAASKALAEADGRVVRPYQVEAIAIAMDVFVAEANTREVERRHEAEAEVSRLEALVYVPGVWRCPKCQLSLVSTILDASSGRIAANKEPQRCPNDCGPMWRVTERDAGNRLVDDMDREVERRREAEEREAFWRERALREVSAVEALGWAITTFGSVAADRRERLLRFIEEAIETAHAGNLSADDLGRVIVRVFGRDPGEISFEMAQAGLCLIMLSAVVGIDLREGEKAEYARIQAISKEEWARRHAAKVRLGIAQAQEGSTDA